MQNLYGKTIIFVDNAFGAKKPHFERTVLWLERISPLFTEAHKIAAYAHDIERAFRAPADPIPNNYLDEKHLKHHQEKSAEIMVNFLKENNADQSTQQTVQKLISKHEVGGDNEQNALMDADSVSFFETNAEMFVRKKAPVDGYDRIKEKLDWMFNRIVSTKAKEATREDYEYWSTELEKNFK